MSQADTYPEARVDFLTYHEATIRQILNDFKQLARDPDRKGVVESEDILQMVWKHSQD